jgi:hypothetical protein
LIAGAVVLTAGLGLWLALSRSGEPRRAAAVAEDGKPVTRTAQSAAPAPPESPPSSRPALESSEIVGAHPDDPHEPGMLPHPITPEHERIFAENRTIGALNDAMAFRDVKKMRELLLEYRKIDPQDVHATQAGYEVVADCIEFPGEASLAAAREYYDTERHSPLRRFVRRICFENAD